MAKHSIDRLRGERKWNDEADYRIYTDGGCHPNPGHGTWAYVLVDQHNYVMDSGRGDVMEVTNNQMELRACIEGLKSKELPLGTVSVYTDSRYARDGITKWIHGWRKNGFVTKTGQPVKNQELWLELDKLVWAKGVKFYWIKGHSGNRFNEIVNRMCQT